MSSSPEPDLVLAAPAKINLYLEVLGRRADGFHEIVTVLQTVDLADTLALRLRPRRGEVPRGVADVSLAVTQQAPARGDVPAGPENLVIRAADLVLREAGRIDAVGLDVALHKRVPAGGGLGGGSSDAASTLRGVNALLDAPCAPSVLARLAASLGSDVPFFLHGGTCLCTGRGERVQPMAPPAPFALTLFLPGFGVPTPSVYAALAAPRLADAPASARLAALSRAWDGADVARLDVLYRNDLERAAERAEPRLAPYLREPRVHLSGSGSTLFQFGPRASDASSDVPRVPECFVTTASRNR